MRRTRPPRRTSPSRAAHRTRVAHAAGRRFTPEDVSAALRALEGGVPAPIVCRRFGVSDRTLYRWRREAAVRERPG